MGPVTIQVQYKVQKSGRDKITLRISGDVEELRKIAINPVLNTLGEHHMRGYDLVVDCEEKYDNHLSFETIIPQICQGLKYSYTFADLGTDGRPSTGGHTYPIKIELSAEIHLSLYDKSIIFKINSYDGTLSDDAFTKKVKEFMKFMSNYDYKFEDKFSITATDEEGVKYSRSVLKVLAKGQESKFITDMKNKKPTT